MFANSLLSLQRESVFKLAFFFLAFTYNETLDDSLNPLPKCGDITTLLGFHVVRCQQRACGVAFNTRLLKEVSTNHI